MRDGAPPIRGGLNLVVLIAASAASAMLLHAASRAGSAAAMLLAAAGFALTANTLFSLLHESVHRLLHRTPVVNEWGGRLAAAWFPTGLQVQRAFHLTHHRNNRSPEEQFDILHDGDVRWLKRAQWYAILTGLYWAVAVLGVLTYALVPRALRMRMLRARESRVAEQTSSRAYLNALEALDPVVARLEIALAVAFQALLFVTLDLTVTGWLACYGAFGLLWSSFQYADHAYSPLDPQDGAWDLRVDPIRRVFLLNYQHHRAHHRHPEVPWYALGSYVDRGEPRPAFWRVWLAMWGGPRAPDEVARVRRALLEPRTSRGFDLVALFAAFFALVYGGASALSAHVPWRVRLDLPFEHAIPFVPAAAFVYLSLDAVLLLAPLLITQRRDQLRLVLTLGLQTVVAAVFFVLLPADPQYAPHAAGDSLVHTVYALADRLCLERNLFPSLHTAFAVTAAWTITRCRGRGAGVLAGLWSAAVVASTLLIHEHHVADLAGGALLAVVTIRAADALAMNSDALRRIDADVRCLREFGRFARRHRRYAVIAAALLWRSVPRWNRARLLRTGFCCLQSVDDLLDGDRPSLEEPLVRTARIADAIEAPARESWDEPDELRLARTFGAELRAVGGSAAVETALALIGVMQTDRRRVIEHRLWSRDELRSHHRRTFTLSIDLMLLADRADVRADDVPELIDAFGWCSTMRDLDEDLAAGLVNVPRDVVAASGATVDSVAGGCFDSEALLDSPALHDWMRTERTAALELLDAADRRIRSLGNRRGASVLRMFARSIRRFAERRLPRRFPELRRDDTPLTRAPTVRRTPTLAATGANRTPD